MNTVMMFSTFLDQEVDRGQKGGPYPASAGAAVVCFLPQWYVPSLLTLKPFQDALPRSPL